MDVKELRDWSDQLSRHFEVFAVERTDDLFHEIRERTNRLSQMLKASTPSKPDLAAEARHVMARFAGEPSGNSRAGELLWLAKHVEKWSNSAEPSIPWTRRAARSFRALARRLHRIV